MKIRENLIIYHPISLKRPPNLLLRSFYLVIIFWLSYSNAFSQVDVLIIGGGAGGTSAGIQAARMGAKVTILESTSWLGGMLTAAGVSAIDGNHELPSGIWGEFRKALYEYYGGPEKVSTGWVSHTLFEPYVGNEILQKMADIPNLNIIYQAKYTGVERSQDKWIVQYIKGGKSQSIESKILIDATETGELLPLVGADFRLGMDSKNDTGESEAPENANSIVQDLTYVAILEDVGTTKGKKGLVKKPKDYNTEEFECACKRQGGEMFGAVLDCEQMLTYGKLPNNKYMINWPNCGNDFYLNWPELSVSETAQKIEAAKAHTLSFIYYIQNDLGFRNLRIADEFPTKDGLPFIPYHREARRLKGKVFLTTNHLKNPYEYNFYRTGIAVGDYPIDHHHDKNPAAPEIDFIDIRIASYNIPMGVLIPENIPDFLVAEKNISVSNIVNGTTRLQPVVLSIGQAAGTLAAIAAEKSISPDKVSIRDVQEELLRHGAYLMPYIDIKPDDIAFAAVQKIGATGILKGFGIPYKWANQTWFYPERLVSEYEWKDGLVHYFPEIKNIPASGQAITINFINEVLKIILPESLSEITPNKWNTWAINQTYGLDTPLNRRSVSILTDQLLDPFHIPVDFNGHIIRGN